MRRALWILLLVGFSLLPQRGPAAVRAERPFALPFAEPPGVSTWFVSQWYGNTVSAFRNRASLYAAGQGLHFGVDFAARCGTIVRAIGDGTVVAVDGPYGAAPHNVVIDHGNGYRSLYGHLLERSPLQVGQKVRRGEPVGEVGDPAGPRCDRAPHLHLEIRDTTMRRAYNPVTLIDADWPRLTLGLRLPGQQFMLSYDDPERWRLPSSQPEVLFGGPRLNDWRGTWPPS
ncbi:MAG: M23 family metallopeptidase [Thermomicrobium sp.]|nr:M23 family metallopeptidase [Thermomicrobium sp.]MDW8058944.1 M23 family metallopeptidase [Thermomicrobium sp.]